MKPRRLVVAVIVGTSFSSTSYAMPRRDLPSRPATVVCSTAMGDGVRFGKDRIQNGDAGRIDRVDEVLTRGQGATNGQVRIDPNQPVFGERVLRDDVDPTQLGAAALGGGKHLRLFGLELERAGTPIKIPRPFENSMANLLGGLFANR